MTLTTNGRGEEGGEEGGGQDLYQLDKEDDEEEDNTAWHSIEATPLTDPVTSKQVCFEMLQQHTHLLGCLYNHI